MISKFLGYVFAGVLLLMFFAPIPFAIYLNYDALVALNNSDSAQATIIQCQAHRSSGSGNRSTSWRPVASLADGRTVEGSFGWTKREWCEGSVGEQVEVLIDPQNGNPIKINSFMQLWFLPLLMLAIASIIVWVSVLGYRKKYRDSKQ